MISEFKVLLVFFKNSSQSQLMLISLIPFNSGRKNCTNETLTISQFEIDTFADFVHNMLLNFV